jgi:hypothetical protein
MGAGEQQDATRAAAGAQCAVLAGEGGDGVVGQAGLQAAGGVGGRALDRLGPGAGAGVPAQLAVGRCRPGGGVERRDVGGVGRAAGDRSPEQAVDRRPHVPDLGKRGCGVDLAGLAQAGRVHPQPVRQARGRRQGVHDRALPDVDGRDQLDRERLIFPDHVVGDQHHAASLMALSVNDH